MSLSASEKKKKRQRSQDSSQSTQSEQPPYIKQVVENKLKKHPEYQDKLGKFTDEEWIQEAKRLTEPDMLHTYFSHLTDEAYENHVLEVGEEAEDTDFGNTFSHDKERKEAGDRLKFTLEKASKHSVKLYLRELKQASRVSTKFMCLFAKKYGPLHVALQVDDVVVDWDDSSLVIPTQGVFEDPIFRGDLSKHTSAAVATTQLVPQMTDAVKHMKYDNCIDLLFDVSVNFKKMIENLIKVISKYNKRYSYHIVSRNCHTFVTEAMEAMGIKKFPTFKGKLKEYFTEVKKGKREAIPDEFPTHEELDRFVTEIKDQPELTQYDKEYLLCLYFQFHLKVLREADDSSKEEEVLECQVAGCNMGMLEKLIDGQPLILLQYESD